jgi:prophage antirepressor-like protein
VVDIDGSPWFVAADVCRALGLKPHTSGGWGHHLGRLGEDEVTPISELGVNAKGHGMNHAKAITESGLYKLVLRSDKDRAKEFQDWVTRDVLPAIRKDGLRQ